MAQQPEAPNESSNFINRALGAIEVIGNKLPDPMTLFVLGAVAVVVVSQIADVRGWSVEKPVIKDGVQTTEEVEAVGLLTRDGFFWAIESMVDNFVTFPPLGVVLVALLGIGVAERTGFINALIKTVLSFTPRALLTPVLILVGVASHYAVDAGYVLVIPLGGVIFYAAGRHPLAGIAAAFAGVSGGFSANFWIPSGLDPLLQGFTLSAAQLLDPAAQVSIVNNNVFTAVSTVMICLVGWVLTDKVIEPRVSSTEIDGDPEEMPKMEEVTPEERRGMIAGDIIRCLPYAWRELEEPAEQPKDPGGEEDGE